MEEKNGHFTFITPRIAIGEVYSSNDSFDIIVNISSLYPLNQIITTSKGEKVIICIGLDDTPGDGDGDRIAYIIETIIPVLLEKGTTTRILFTGNISIAIAYLIAITGKDYIEIITFIQKKRGVIQPTKESEQAICNWVKSSIEYYQPKTTSKKYRFSC